jgi:hypothetical protein
MENNQNSKSEPIEREFYVLTVDKLNKKSRIHTRETVLKWIEDLEKKEIPYYKIEYAINVPIEEVKNPFINDSLFCGAVVKLELRGNELYATAKFKKNSIPTEKMLDNNFYDNLTLTPKGKGNVKNNKIYNYVLIGFNLVEEEKSTFSKVMSDKLNIL